jgi:hypothetical protein
MVSSTSGVKFLHCIGVLVLECTSPFNFFFSTVFPLKVNQS